MLAAAALVFVAPPLIDDEDDGGVDEDESGKNWLLFCATAPSLERVSTPLLSPPFRFNSS